MQKAHLSFIIILFAINSFGQSIELDIDLVAYYPFNGNPFDASGNQNDGILYGPELTEDRKGVSGSAYLFDGVDDYILVPDKDLLSFPDQQFSISFWIKSFDIKNSYFIYKGSNQFNREYGIGIRPDKLPSIQINNQGDASTQVGTPGTTIFIAQQWYHIVGTWDGNYLSIYINGQKENQIEYKVIIGNYNSDLIFGTYIGNIGLYAFNGVIDDIYIYSRVLNSCEIEALYDGYIFEER